MPHLYAKHLKEWTRNFKALANEIRLQILYLLDKEGELAVKTISNKLGRGVKITSKHLGILSNIGFLQSHGKLGSVYYKLDPDLRDEVKHIIIKFLRR